MEILLWLVPAAVATTLAMAWAGWAGRAGRGEVDRERAVRRLGEALDRPTDPTRRSARADARPRAGQLDRSRVRTPAPHSTGVVVRRRAS